MVPTRCRPAAAGPVRGLQRRARFRVGPSVRTYLPPTPAISEGGVIPQSLDTPIILTTENRLGRIQERSAQLNLQMTTLAEAKVAKVIDLVERLRSDNPFVEDRADPQAQAMVEATDPKRVIEVIEKRHGANDRS
jgi:hypothetical protein